MENKKIIAVIDLGTFNLKCAIFSLDQKGSSKLIGFSKKKTEGIHNSIIVNFDTAINSVRECLAEAEKLSQINLEKINVIFDPTDVLTTRITKFKKIDGMKLEKNDVSFLLKEAKKQIEQNNLRYSNIHIFNYKYMIDNKFFKNFPPNIYADQFSQENVFLSVPKNVLKNISEVFHSCDIEIDKFISCSYSLGAICFNQSQIDYGCGIIDIGYEKTSLALFRESSLVYVSSFPIGSNHITKDISRGCYLSEVDSDKFLSDKFFSNSKFRKISHKFVKNIISARVDEILNKINKELNFLQADSIKQNLVLLGEGSKFKDLKEIIKNRFSDCNFDFDITNIKTLAEVDRELLSCYGAFKILTEGFSSEAIALPHKRQKNRNGLFSRIFNIFD